MAKSYYSKYLNRYISTDLKRLDKDPYYWRQGIGKTRAVITEEIEEEVECVFDYTFDSTFCNGETVLTRIFNETFDNTFN